MSSMSHLSLVLLLMMLLMLWVISYLTNANGSSLSAWRLPQLQALKKTTSEVCDMVGKILKGKDGSFFLPNHSIDNNKCGDEKL